jgi:hypothetical protein
MRQILTENKTIRLLKIWNVELIVSNGLSRLPNCSSGKVTSEVTYEAGGNPGSTWVFCR